MKHSDSTTELRVKDLDHLNAIRIEDAVGCTVKAVHSAASFHDLSVIEFTDGSVAILNGRNAGPFARVPWDFAIKAGLATAEDLNDRRLLVEERRAADKERKERQKVQDMFKMLTKYAKDQGIELPEVGDV